MISINARAIFEVGSMFTLYNRDLCGTSCNCYKNVKKYKIIQEENEMQTVHSYSKNVLVTGTSYRLSYVWLL